jgi:hypothetical protein
MAWEGPFRMNRITGAEFDTVPPSPATGPAGNLDQGDLFYDDRDAFQAALYPQLVMAPWESGDTPDGADCDVALSINQVGGALPQPGQYLCVGTPGGRIAGLEVIEVDYSYVRFNVTVWVLQS